MKIDQSTDWEDILYQVHANKYSYSAEANIDKVVAVYKLVTQNLGAPKMVH